MLNFVINYNLFLNKYFLFSAQTKQYLLLLPVDMMGGQYVARWLSYPRGGDDLS